MLKWTVAPSVALMLLFLAAGVAAFALTAWGSLRTQRQLDYGEGVVLWQAANVTNWEMAYHPVENYPHVVFVYPPFYHLSARLVAATTGNLLTAGRLISILSLTGCCLVMAILTAVCLPPGHSIGARWLGSFSAGTLIFTTPVWTWACFMRVDTLGLLLDISGLALFVLARRRPALAFLSFACFVAAVYTKQTFVAAPAACLLLAFLEKPGLSVRLFAFAVSTGIAVLIVLHVITDGLFLRHIISYNQNPFSLLRMLNASVKHVSNMTALLSIAVMFPVALVCRRAESVPILLQRVRLALSRSVFERCVIVFAVYFWFAAAVSATVGKTGSAVNYFFEVDIAASLLSGLFLGWLIRRVSFRPRGPYALLASLVLPLFLLHLVGNFVALKNTVIDMLQPASDHEELVHFLRELPGPVYSDYMTALVQAGKEIPADPFIITALAETNQWDESSFVRRIEQGQFQAIVVNSSLDQDKLFTASVAQAVKQRYSVGKEFSRFKVYLPR